MKNTYHNSFVSFFFLKEIYKVLYFFSFNCTFSLEKKFPPSLFPVLHVTSFLFTERASLTFRNAWQCLSSI